MNPNHPLERLRHHVTGAIEAVETPAIRKETITNTFGAIRVEIHYFEESGEQRAMGDVTYIDPTTGTEYNGSLDRLIGMGTLEDYGTGEEIEIRPRLVDEIEGWANAEGY